MPCDKSLKESTDQVFEGPKQLAHLHSCQIFQGCPNLHISLASADSLPLSPALMGLMVD